MKWKEISVFVVIAILLICIVGSSALQIPDVQRRGVLIRNTGFTPTANADITHTKRKMKDNEMTIIARVLKDTLVALSKYNSRLASYFVQHHPTLTNLYNKINTKAEPSHITTTKRPILSRREDIKSVHVTNGKTNPLFIRLSEFQNSQPTKKRTESMNVESINAGSMAAIKVTSDIVRARKIAVDDVHVTGSRNTDSLPDQRHSYLKTDRRASTGTVSSSSSQMNRRNYFPPRTDNSNNRNALSGIHLRNSNPSTLVRAKAGRNNEHQTTQKPLPVEESSFWDDDWSEAADSDDEYYYDYEDVTTDKSPSVISGSQINANAIVAGSMVADSVMADEIHVPRIIADDVDISASYGK